MVGPVWTVLLSDESEFADAVEDPLAFVVDGGAIAVAGVNGGVTGESQQAVADRSQDRRFVAVAASGCPRPATEQGVARHHPPSVHVEETAATGRMPRSVNDPESVATGSDGFAGRQRAIGRVFGEHHIPEHLIVGMQQNRASTASRSATAALMWSLWPCVQTIAATRRPLTASTIG